MSDDQSKTLTEILENAQNDGCVNFSSSEIKEMEIGLLNNEQLEVIQKSLTKAFDDTGYPERRTNAARGLIELSQHVLNQQQAQQQKNDRGMS